MVCRLTNLIDVALLVSFDSGRELLLNSGDSCFYDDTREIVVDDCWDFVEFGWIKEEDWEESIIKTHDWSLEGF